MLSVQMSELAASLKAETERWLKKERAGQHPDPVKLKGFIFAIEETAQQLGRAYPEDKNFADTLETSAKEILDFLSNLAGKSVYSPEGGAIVSSIEKSSLTLVENLQNHTRTLHTHAH